MAFEHYMLADDRPSHSMTCHVRFWFRGLFDREAFLHAVREVLPRHPVFQLTFDGSLKRQTKHLSWKRSDALVMPFVSWSDSETPLDPPAGGFAQDLFRGIGLRFWIRESATPSPTQTMMLVQFHHAVCDGIGLFQFMEDLLIAYGKLGGQPMPPMRTLDPSVFPRRGDFSLTPEDWRKRRRVDVKRAATFFKTLAQPIGAPAVPKDQLTAVADLHAAERILLSAEVLAALRTRARGLNASVNDLLIHDLFHVLGKWNAAYGTSRRAIRIAVATSLRGVVEEQLSATNVVSMAFLSRSRRALGSPALLPSIVAEMGEIKDDRLGITLPRVMRRLGRYHGGVHRFLRLPLCSSTAVLTNLGRPFAGSALAGEDGKLRVGDVTLESLETLPPVRPRTRASFSVNYYGGALSVTLRYDSTVMSRGSAEELLARYAARLRASEGDVKAHPSRRDSVLS